MKLGPGIARIIGPLVLVRYRLPKTGDGQTIGYKIWGK